MLFAANNGGSGGFDQKLWKSDGTTAGTVPVHTLRSYSNLSASNRAIGSAMVEMNGKVYFFADDGVHGCELFVTDGTDAGTQLVKDIYPGTSSSIETDPNDPFLGLQRIDTHLTRMGNRLLFLAKSGPGAFNLWVSDGTSARTQQLNTTGNVAGLITFNGWEYFEVTTATPNVFTLWRTDGTAAGTQDITSTLIPGGSARGGAFSAVADNGFFFGASGGGNTGLWFSDGTATHTQFVTSNDMSSGGACANGEFFWGNSAATGTELWFSDGTAAGTHLVKDLNPGTGSSMPTGSSTAVQWFNLDGLLLFTANTPGQGSELWRSDGTDAGTFRLTGLNGSLSSSPDSLVKLNGIAYFAATSGSSRIWCRTDGSVTGTKTNIATNLSSVSDAATANGAIYFAAADAFNGIEPWKQPDDVGPLVRASSFRYDLPQHAAILKFNESLAGTLTEADVTITDLGTSTPLPGDSFAVTTDGAGNATVTFPGFANARLRDGSYRLSIAHAGVSDAAGNAMTADYSLDFFVLAGDANHDRAVDTLDFNVLAGNFGGTGKTYSQADFNYDGVVDTLDFNTLASQFGKMLPPSSPSISMEFAAPAPVSFGDNPIKEVRQSESELVELI